MTQFEEIKMRLESFEAPVSVPAGYDPKCTCGSAVPECPECYAVSRQYARKREILASHAAADLRFLLDFLISEGRV